MHGLLFYEVRDKLFLRCFWSPNFDEIVPWLYRCWSDPSLKVAVGPEPGSTPGGYAIRLLSIDEERDINSDGRRRSEQCIDKIRQISFQPLSNPVPPRLALTKPNPKTAK